MAKKKQSASICGRCTPRQSKCTCSMCLKEEFNGEPEFYLVVGSDTLCKFCLDEVRKFIEAERKKAYWRFKSAD